MNTLFDMLIIKNIFRAFLIVTVPFSKIKLRSKSNFFLLKTVLDIDERYSRKYYQNKTSDPINFKPLGA
jgi:hypothetical protein